MAHKLRRASHTGVSNLKLFLESDKKRFDDSYGRKTTYKETLEDFKKIRTLGTGSFGRVLLVRHKPTRKYYAMKVMSKAKLIELEQVEHTLNERRILQCLNFPFLVYMVFEFFDNSYIYFVLPFVIGGEMYTLLKKYKTFDEDLAKFYAGQIVLGLEYLHFLDLVYRDLKPENLLIDGTGYIKITDFGFCKKIKGRTHTLCGTPQYLAPEIVLGRGYGNEVDWWSFGILVFEMNAGSQPFEHKNLLMLYDKIVAGKYKVPNHFSISLRDLVRNLLQVDSKKRYGNLKGGISDIKGHRWFKQIKWMALLNRELDPPYKPPVKDPKDGTNFETYDEKPLFVSVHDHYKKEFADF